MSADAKEQVFALHTLQHFLAERSDGLLLVQRGALHGNGGGLQHAGTPLSSPYSSASCACACACVRVRVPPAPPAPLPTTVEGRDHTHCHLVVAMPCFPLFFLTTAGHGFPYPVTVYITSVCLRWGTRGAARPTPRTVRCAAGRPGTTRSS